SSESRQWRAVLPPAPEASRTPEASGGRVGGPVRTARHCQAMPSRSALCWRGADALELALADAEELIDAAELAHAPQLSEDLLARGSARLQRATADHPRFEGVGFGTKRCAAGAGRDAHVVAGK